MAMIEYWNKNNLAFIKENLLPVAIKDVGNVEDVEELLVEKEPCVSFSVEHVAKFTGKGAYVVLDYGKELCGSIRMICRTAFGKTKCRITLGESLTECCSKIGEKNSTNDHSPRDFKVDISGMSDLTFGLSGFRFARIELLTEDAVWFENIFAVSSLPFFEKEGYIRTSDPEVNRIIETAAYTLKLNLQNGYIWDGIKRDRLVWCGDLHQEIINSLYLYGDNQNVRNSLAFLRNDTPKNSWINTIPSYSAWWVINLCDYCRMTGNTAYFQENKDYAMAVMDHFEQCIKEDGTFDFQLPPDFMSYFLDWPTKDSDDAIIGTAAIIMVAANKLLEMEEHENSRNILRKLKVYLDKSCKFKQTRAFQILAGRSPAGEETFLEEGGAAGFSTFMAYYILTADSMAGGKNMLAIVKEYFGAMLSRGATTFWEDFHMDWLDGSGRIDEFPKEGEKDIHGDYGAYCYKGFRHSLCHGWASGVLAFLIEQILGLKLLQGETCYEINPHLMELDWIEAKIPIQDGWLTIHVSNDQVISEIEKNDKTEKILRNG